MTMDFDAQYRNWQRVKPHTLFDDRECKEVAKNLLKYSHICDELILWLDCDREGEAIAFEVMQVCQRIKPKIKISRAMFSAITKVDVERACANLVQPNRNLAMAVQARQELDLRIGTLDAVDCNCPGSSFTRFITLKYMSNLVTQTKVLSFGPCQIPTLAFVVERYNRIVKFVPEPFWTIVVEHATENATAHFKWQRGRLFDEAAALVLYEACLQTPLALVTKVQERKAKRHAPKPLETVEMNKCASRWLGIPSHECMQVAEALYNKGFISYPRTETDVFPSTMNLNQLVQQLTAEPAYQDYARKLLAAGDIVPRGGSKSDEAHPPIHPIKLLTKTTAESPVQYKLYDFIARRFLASCSQPAIGSQSFVLIDISGELFHTTGLYISDYSWLEIYPFETWTNKPMPLLVPGQTFTPSKVALENSSTSPPKLITESQLIGLMNKHGIGTDATMHEHILKIQERHYCTKVQGQAFVPTYLGRALVAAFKSYKDIAMDLTKPKIRAKMERDWAGIANAELRQKDVVRHHVNVLKDVYMKIETQSQKFDQVMQQLTWVQPDDAPLPSAQVNSALAF